MTSGPGVSAVVDTNVIVSAFLSRRGVPHALLTAFHAGAFRLILLPTLWDEYADVLARPQFTLAAEEVAAFFRFLARRA